MSTHKIGFYEDLKKIIIKYQLRTLSLLLALPCNNALKRLSIDIMTNSKDPDQTVPLGSLFLVCTVSPSCLCKNLRIFIIISGCFQQYFGCLNIYDLCIVISQKSARYDGSKATWSKWATTRENVPSDKILTFIETSLI